VNLENPPAQHQLLKYPQLFQYPPFHQIDRYGQIVGELRIEDGQIVSPSNPPAISQRSIGGGTATIGANGKAQLKESAFLCQGVQIQSIREDFSDNQNRIGVGDSSNWFSSIEPHQYQLIDAPTNGVLDLSKIYVYGVEGDQVKYFFMNSI
jgi:hypothetical protein